MNLTRRATSHLTGGESDPGRHQVREIPSSRKQGPAPSRLCPVCASRESVTFYRVQSAPVTSASLFATPTEAKSVTCGTIELAVCNRCAFVFNGAFNSALAQVGAKYETTQGASAHFGAYARSVASDWVQRYGLAGKTVVEIGCGSGEFLVELLRAGVGKAIGIDPLIARQSVVSEGNSRLELIAAAFEEGHTNIESAALVCRHTLEHIPDVGGFLQLVARWARRSPDRVALFEVPASERIFSECAFWDIYYEHCNYFTRASLSYAFAHFGLDVQKLEQTYDDEYLVLEARPAAYSSVTPMPADVPAAQRSALAFGDRVDRTIELAQRNLQALAEQGPLVIWQGAAKTVGFLTTLGDPDSVSCAIDLNPRRHGSYLPGLMVRVMSPDAITSLHPRHVVLMNPVYVREVDSFLRGKGSDARLLTVNQVCGEL